MNIGWSELMMVGIVALVVIGPKDLPGMFREVGRFTAKMRSMGREFSRAMEQAAKESGVKDVADDLRKVTSPKAMGLDAVKSAADKFEKWDPLKPAAKPAAAPVTAADAPVAAAAAAAPAVAATVGPETAALAEKVAARKAVTADAAAKLKAINSGASAAEPVAEAPAKRPGRTRKPAKSAGDTA